MTPDHFMRPYYGHVILRPCLQYAEESKGEHVSGACAEPGIRLNFAAAQARQKPRTDKP